MSFKRGYKGVREEQKRQEENREKMQNQIWRFFLKKDGEEADVRFLTNEPINFYEHTVATNRGGKEYFDSVICIEEKESCVHCENGDRPSFKGAYLIYDKREYETTDPKTKKKVTKEGSVRLYVAGTTILSQLDRINTKYGGLTSRDFTITRSGKGTSTSYQFDRSDNVGKMTKREIEALLPEQLREMYDGSEDSLYEMVISQLENSVQSNSKKSYEEDDEEEVYENKRRKNLVSDDEDEEDEPPKKSTFKSGKSLNKKSSAKGLMKRR